MMMLPIWSRWLQPVLEYHATAAPDCFVDAFSASSMNLLCHNAHTFKLQVDRA